MLQSRGRVQTCERCKRTSTCPNPCPRRHKGNYLNFTSPTSALCLSCKNWMYACGKDIQVKDLLASLQTAEGQASYDKSLHQLEEIFDASEGKQMRGVMGKIHLPEVIARVFTEGIEETVHMPVFWPEDLLKKKNVPYESSQLEVHGGSGKKGIWRDKEHGTPTGCITRDAKRSDMLVRKKVRCTSELGASSAHMDKAIQCCCAGRGTSHLGQCSVQKLSQKTSTRAPGERVMSARVPVAVNHQAAYLRAGCLLFGISFPDSCCSGPSPISGEFPRCELSRMFSVFKSPKGNSPARKQ